MCVCTCISICTNLYVYVNYFSYKISFSDLERTDIEDTTNIYIGSNVS